MQNRRLQLQRTLWELCGCSPHSSWAGVVYFQNCSSPPETSVTLHAAAPTHRRSRETASVIRARLPTDCRPGAVLLHSQRVTFLSPVWIREHRKINKHFSQRGKPQSQGQSGWTSGCQLEEVISTGCDLSSVIFQGYLLALWWKEASCFSLTAHLVTGEVSVLKLD